MRPAFKDEFLMKNFKKLIKKHKITKLFETGTWKGVSTGIASHYVDKVCTVEINPQFLQEAKRNNAGNEKIDFYLGSSPDIMRHILEEGDNDWIFFLDAHWQKDWPILRELEIIAKKKIRPVIMIHDFYVPDGKGGAKFRFDSYGNQNLDFEFVKSGLEEVYGKDGFTYYYSDQIGCVNSALIYIEPK